MTSLEDVKWDLRLLAIVERGRSVPGTVTAGADEASVFYIWYEKT